MATDQGQNMNTKTNDSTQSLSVALELKENCTWQIVPSPSFSLVPFMFNKQPRK